MNAMVDGKRVATYSNIQSRRTVLNAMLKSSFTSHRKERPKRQMRELRKQWPEYRRFTNSLKTAGSHGPFGPCPGGAEEATHPN